MSAKRILFHAAAREKILSGATQLTDAVRITLGPHSKAVLIQKRWGRPQVCDDGVTIAKEFELRDAEENLGAQMIREPAERTQAEVGDGTTTAMILAQAIYAEGVRNVAAGAVAVELKRGLEKGLELVKASLEASSRPTGSRRERAQVASIAAHNDTAIGGLVADAFEKVGPTGVVSVEEAKGTETTLEVVEGMQFDNGYLSPYFVTDAERMEAVLEDALVLLTDKRIATMTSLVPVLEQVAKSGRAILIICEELEPEPMATLVVNRLRGVLRCAAAHAPGFGDRRKALLEDLAVLTGGQVISQDVGLTLEKVPLEMLGQAKRVVLTQDKTTVIGGAGEKAKIAARVERLKRELKDAGSDYDKEKLEERLAKLSGGVAVIRVGAASEAELKNRKDAFDDAINATRAAMAEGIVPGAGLALLRAASELEKEEARLDGDLRTGLRILRHALELPTRQIAENAGVDGGVVVERMRNGEKSQGFDASRNAYVDLLEAGIIDATKVVRVGLENAVSTAGTLLLAEATLTEEREKPAKELEVPELEG